MTKLRFPDLKLRQGQVYIQQLRTQPDGKPVQVPSGLIHHWVGIAFIPGASVPQTLAVLEDYDNHKNVYKPDVRRQSKLLEHSGNQFKVYLQFYRKSLATAVVNANFDVQYTLLDTTRATSKSYSTRIAEVANSGKPDEHEFPVERPRLPVASLQLLADRRKGRRDYIQVESVGLSRSVLRQSSPKLSRCAHRGRSTS